MSIITRINKAEKRIVDLYNKLKNLPSGGVQSVIGGLVDNTDPNNPVIVDAPSDGTQYARKDGTWKAVPEGSAGKQFKAFIRASASGGNITTFTVLQNDLGLTGGTWTRFQEGIYTLTFSNASTVLTGTFYTLFGLSDFGDKRFISCRKIGNTIYVYCTFLSDGTYQDLLPNTNYSIYFENL